MQTERFGDWLSRMPLLVQLVVGVGALIAWLVFVFVLWLLGERSDEALIFEGGRK